MKNLKYLNDGYHETIKFCGYMSKLEFLGEYIFGFSVYEQQYYEDFAKTMLVVCDAISEGKTYEFIQVPTLRRDYYLMVNMPFLKDKIEWGTSIRGAWWNEHIVLRSCGLYDDDKQILELDFTDDEWRQFINSMYAFISMEPEK